MKEEIENCSHDYKFSHTEKGYTNPQSTTQIDVYYDVVVCPKCGSVIRSKKPFF